MSLNTHDLLLYTTKIPTLHFVIFSPPKTNPDKGSSAPENYEIMQEEHEKQVVYVCLIEKFYPEVIRVKWTDEANKEVTQNVVKGDVWKSPGEDKYSVSTWLSVPLESKNKIYSCTYEHESGGNSLSTQGKYCISF